MRWARTAAPVLALQGALALAMPGALHGQTLTGRALEEGREVPVRAALVTLVDPGGDVRAEALTDSTGAFTLEVPRPGSYFVEARRLGYERFRSPLLALSGEERVVMELMLRPEPVGLEGLDVTTEARAEEFLQPLGFTPAALGRRWIDRADIERMPLPAGPGEVVKWMAPVGVWVDQSNGGGPFDELCVQFLRNGRAGCALVVLNGVPIDIGEAQGIDPQAIEAMALLRPAEAVTFYGTQAGNGVVLIWTRRGG